MLKLKGHLLDRQVFNKTMDILESFKIEFLVHSMWIGNSSTSKSIIEIQIKCENMPSVQDALAEIYDLCEEFDV